MKNTMKTLVCLLLVLGTLFCLTACGGSSGGSSIGGNKTSTPTQTTAPVKQTVIGRYELEKVQWANGTTASGEVLQSSETLMGDMYVELFSDRTAQLSLYGTIRDMEYTDTEMKWVDSPLDKYEFSVGNGKVILKKDGDTFTFVKK